MNGKKVAVVGATGAVGREVVKTLDARAFPVSELKLFASLRSARLKIPFQKREIVVEAIGAEENFSGMDIVFFTAGSSVSRTYAPRAVAAGAVVIDNSSLYRMDKGVPLVVPEINAHAIGSNKLIANPNCTTAQMVMVLKPLHDAFKIKRVLLSSYQAVSGKGQKGVDEFLLQAEDVLAGKKPEVREFPHQIAFNCLPQVDIFEADGFTGEEHKVMNETRKILGDESIRVAATCVRVPVINCHSEMVAIECEKSITVESAREALSRMPGVKVLDDVKNQIYPLATEASGKDDVFVGRIRRDPSCDNGLLLWIVADNLRKGAALNAVQIAEKLL